MSESPYARERRKEYEKMSSDDPGRFQYAPDWCDLGWKHCDPKMYPEDPKSCTKCKDWLEECGDEMLNDPRTTTEMLRQIVRGMKECGLK